MLHARTRTALSAAISLLLVGCATVPGVGTGLSASLTGTPNGDADGTGTATITIDDAANQLGTTLQVSGIAPATAAHIHRGAAGTSGPPVVPLDAPSDGESSECDGIAQELLDEILANPAGFYVNVHNADFPGGAIRGQLQPR